MRTIDECRDWLAADEGWVYYPDSVPMNYGRGVLYPDPGPGWKRGREVRSLAYGIPGHPIPATLGAAAAAMPEGWSVKLWIENGVCNGEAWGPGSLEKAPIVRADPSDERCFRFNLAVLVREKIKENKQ